jgi:hypothetical protein
MKQSTIKTRTLYKINDHNYTSYRVVKKRNNSIKKSKNHPLNFKLVYKFSIFILVMLGIFFTAQYISKAQTFNEKLKTVISNLDKDCKSFNENQGLKSLLNITVSNNQNIKSVHVYFYDKNNLLDLDFTNIEFAIDKSGTKGNFQKYITNNNVYLSDKEIYKNVSNLFLSQFLINVDHVVVNNENYGLKEYVNDKASLEVSYESGKSLISPIQTDLCIESWDKFINDFNREMVYKKSLAYSSNFKLSDYFDFLQIRKEQIRVHINNKTGVESYGGQFSQLLKNYGVNVIKIDNSTSTTTVSSILVDDQNIMNTESLNQIRYLAKGIGATPSTQSFNNIFADVYIELGQDLLIR